MYFQVYIETVSHIGVAFCCVCRTFCQCNALNLFEIVLLRNIEPKDVGKYSKRQILNQFEGSTKHVINQSISYLKEMLPLGTDDFRDDEKINETTLFTVYFQY